MPTLKELQSLYKQRNLGTPQLYKQGETTYLQFAPTEFAKQGFVFQDPDLSQLNRSALGAIKPLSGVGAGGISFTAADETFQRAQQQTARTDIGSILGIATGFFTQQDKEAALRKSNLAQAPSTAFSFRPRREGESMASYLEDRQRAGDTSITLPGADFKAATTPTTGAQFDERGNLITASGQKISPQDPNFDAFVAQAGGGALLSVDTTSPEMIKFIESAKQQGFQINEATGEVINPTPELIAQFNQQFPTTPEPEPFKKDDDIVGKSGEMNLFLDRVLESYGEKGENANALANDAFIQATAQAAHGRPASADELRQVGEGGMIGASLKDVATAFGLSDRLPALGVVSPEDEGKTKDQTIKDLQAKVDAGGTLTTIDKANWKTATGDAPPPTAKVDEPTKPDVTEPGEAEIDASGKPNVITDTGQIISGSDPNYDEFVAGGAKEANDQNIIEESGVSGGVDLTETTATDINGQITTLQNELLTLQETYQTDIDNIEAQTIPQKLINRQSAERTAQYDKEAYYKEARLAIAQGNFDRLRELAKDADDDLLDISKEKRELVDDGWTPLTDELAEGLDKTQYLELPDGTKWMYPETGTGADSFNITNWAKNILDGTATLGNAPSEIRTQINNRVTALLDSGYVGFTPEQKDQLNKMSSDLRQEPMYRDMLAIHNGFKSVEVGFSFQNGYGDLTMVNGFQRMIDPGAVVREGEFKTVADAQGWVQKVLNLPVKLMEGDLLKPEARSKLMSVAVGLYNAKASSYNTMVGATYRAKAEAFNLPYDLIGVDFPRVETGFTVENIFGGAGAEDDVFNNSTLDTIWGQ